MAISRTRVGVGLPGQVWIVGLLAVCIVSTLGPTASARTWKDSTGEYTIDAEYVVSNGTMVRLRKKDGKTVDLPVARLSTLDRLYVRKLMGETAREQGETPAPVAGTSGSSVAGPTVSRHNKERAGQLIEEAAALLKVGAMANSKAIGDKLQEASRLDPSSIEPDFLLGILNALLAKNATVARKDFQKCLTRRPKSIAVLNNLALAEVRMKRYGDAVNHWKQAVSLTTTATPEIVQNVGRLVHVNGKQLTLPKSVYQDVVDIYARLAVRSETIQHSEHVGWLYMLPRRSDIEDGPAPAAIAKSSPSEPIASGAVRLGDLELHGGGTGFVVAPDFILTNRHVVEGAKQVYIKDPKHTAQGFRASVVAMHRGSDLALLRCESLKAAPLTLSTGLPPRGSDIMVLGYPQFDQIGTSLKATRGAVVSIPTGATENMILVDAQINSGNSGGPIVNQAGQVVAVATAVIKTQGGTGGRYGAGLPMAHAMSFVKQHARNLRSEPASTKKLDWPQVDAKVSGSTVLILVDQQPNAPSGGGGDDDGDISIFALEDKSCPGCNGTKMVKRGFRNQPCPFCRGTGLDPSLVRSIPRSYMRPRH